MADMQNFQPDEITDKPNSHSNASAGRENDVVEILKEVTLKNGTVLSDGFSLVEERWLEEYQSKVKLYRHDATGCELLSVINDDTNKTFGIGFRTPPMSDNGVPHILEHVVLAGSERYPLKDPFMAMNRGSLSTFLNAMTYPDMTVYPVASTNQQDFKNLTNVYLDAVFSPLLRPESFKQEGWHYQQGDDGTSLALSGVVYNEMKGALSDPLSQLSLHTDRALFPDNKYGVESGGDPAYIPELTYDEFVGFHKCYYHPSNARVFFYGDMPEAERFSLVQPYLDRYQKIDSSASRIPLQQPFSAPKYVQMEYQSPESDRISNQFINAVSWVLPEAVDSVQAVGFEVLNEVLLGGASGALRLALEKSGLGESLIGAGLQTWRRQWVFSVGLDGMESGKSKELETLVNNTLADLVANGVPSTAVEAALHRFEFGIRFAATRGDKGINLFLSSLPEWMNERSVLDGLESRKLVDAFRDHLATDPKYFEHMIQNHFLDNNHKASVELVPTTDFEEKWAVAEQARLAAVRSSMSELEFANVGTDKQSLLEFQQRVDSAETLAMLPRLHSQDLSPVEPVYSNEKSEIDGVSLYQHSMDADGLVFTQLGFGIDRLSAEQLSWAKLFGDCFTKLGTNQADYVAVSERIRATTGSLSATIKVASKLDDSGEIASEPLQYLEVAAFGLAEKQDDIVALMKDQLTDITFSDVIRLKELVTQERAELERDLLGSGEQIAFGEIAAMGSKSGALRNTLEGRPYLEFLRKVEQQLATTPQAVVSSLEEVKAALVAKDSLFVSTSAVASSNTGLQPALSTIISSLPTNTSTASHSVPLTDTEDRGVVVPGGVNYVGWSVNLYEAGFKKHGSVEVLRRLLAQDFLWKKVREEGGAYGVMTQFDPITGQFSCCSYRDPQMANTLAAYEAIPQFLRGVELSEQDMDELIIGTIGKRDKPVSAAEECAIALRESLTGIGYQERQQIRSEILATTAEQLKAYADVFERAMNNRKIVIAGGQVELESLKASKLPGLTITQV